MADIVKVAGIVIQNGKMLMVKKYSQNFLGMLGGTVEEGETYLECLNREIPEEIGVTDFEILDQEPFYTANSVAGSDISKTLEVQCFRVVIKQDPKPTYDPISKEKTEDGYNISEIHWIGLEELIPEGDNYKLKPIKDQNGNVLTLTPITEEFIFPKFVKLGLI